MFSADARNFSPQKRGIKSHSEWEELAAEKFGRENVKIETSFINGKKLGGKGSIRTDLIIFSSDGKPIGIFDLKTGKAKLSDARINEIRSHLPDEYKDVPIIGIEETNLNN